MPWSSPSRPRAPPAADGCLDGSQSPGPDPVLPAAPPPGALLEHSGHPGKAAGLRDAPMGGGPIRARLARGPRMTRRLLRATPRQATPPSPPSLRALTRVSSCATRARPYLPTTPDGPRGSAFLLTTGSVFLLGSTLASPAFPHSRIPALSVLSALRFRLHCEDILSLRKLVGGMRSDGEQRSGQV